MAARRMVASALAGALAFIVATSNADALTIARVTRYGYILVDEPNAEIPYEGRAPVGNTQDLLAFTAEITYVLEEAGAPRGAYIAVMQEEYENSALAFYLGLANDTRGLGQRNPFDPRQELYDLNPTVGTAYPITGFVFLNAMRLYIDPVYSYFGRYFICTQEFGHRYGVFVRNPPQPGAVMQQVDAGSGSEADAGEADAGEMDASAPDATPPGPDLPSDILLGRQRAHWSYFVHSGGSPMEGNNWEEIEPGVFRTGPPSLEFSPLDLYLMGLIPASAVPPFFVIAEPNVMGQRDTNGHVIWRESPTNTGVARTIRGRRVDFTIDDIIRANGPRDPAYYDRDAGTGDGSAPPYNPDLPVLWVMLTTQDRVTSRLVADFDRAIETCTRGYNDATRERSLLIAMVPPMPDAGVPDAARDADAPEVSSSDAGPDASAPPVFVGGGCGCRAPGVPIRSGGALGAALCCALLARRRRRTVV